MMVFWISLSLFLYTKEEEKPWHDVLSISLQRVAGIEGLFKKNKVEYVKGWGKLKGPNEVDVALPDGGSATMKAKNIVIATGSDVAPLPGVPIDEKR